eukprot:10635701-Ditylum_brightwellii.AAC.1
MMHGVFYWRIDCPAARIGFALNSVVKIGSLAQHLVAAMMHDVFFWRTDCPAARIGFALNSVITNCT